VGCRGKGGRSDLVRVVMVEGVLAPDPRARLAGRGAWVHPDLDCLDLAVRRRALARALRLGSAPDVALVRAEIEARHAGSPADPASDRHDGTT
jgi:hypothetical protein